MFSSCSVMEHYDLLSEWHCLLDQETEHSPTVQLDHYQPVNTLTTTKWWSYNNDVFICQCKDFLSVVFHYCLWSHFHCLHFMFCIPLYGKKAITCWLLSSYKILILLQFPKLHIWVLTNHRSGEFIAVGQRAKLPF